MRPTNLLPALKLPTLLVVAGAALVAVALPASAVLGLPVSLPSAGQHIDTPVGSIDADASENGASACADLATPALPAIPAVPLPLPVPVPAVPDLGAASKDCASAGLDGASASAGAQAAGLSAGTGADVDTSAVHGAAEQSSSAATGFFQGIIDTVMSWF